MSRHLHKPIGGRIFTLPFLVLAVLAAIGLYYLGIRFTQGIGAVANINGGYPWGVWVVFDVVIGTALATGGWVLAFTVYALNKGKYHPLVRPAIMASLFGYALGGFGAFFDMGRYWQFYNVLLPWKWNLNSVMLEVGLCVLAYILVLVIEFAPAFFEKFGISKLKARLEKTLFFFIALGIVLPTMHQSSLGSLLIAAGEKVHPLWQSLQLQPALALVTALIMGFSVVVFESSMSTVGFRRPTETPLLKGLGKGILGLLAVYFVIRFGELIVRGKLGYIFAGDLQSMMFLLETALFIFPAVVLASPAKSANGRMLLWSAASMMLAGSLYRLNAFLIGYDPGPGYSYFPAFGEIMVTVGIVSIEIMAYLVFVKKLPVLPDAEHARI